MNFEVSKILNKLSASFPVVMVLILDLFFSGKDFITIKESNKDFYFFWSSIAIIIFSYLLGIVFEVLSLVLIEKGIFKDFISNKNKKYQEIVYSDIAKFLSLEIGFIVGIILNISILKENALYIFLNYFYFAMFVIFFITLLLYYYVNKT